MARKITPIQIKKNNRYQIYDYIYRNKKVSQNEIALELRLSRPTVATNIADLEEDGLIFKDGQQDSDQIGRKAIVYSAVPDFRISIGVELTSRHIKIIAIDLYAQQIERVIHKQKYNNTDAYYKKVSDSVVDFIDTLNVPKEKILGVGIAMQGLVSPDGNTIVYGKIMNCTGVSIDVFTKHLPYKCTFIHDPEGAALSELWVSPELDDAIYISLSEHLGGALILDRDVSRGKSGHSATFEHIQFDKNGKECYCGKVGCFETVLSVRALIGDEDEDEFFKKVREKGTSESKKWQSFLVTLGSLIGSLHLVNDVDFILGGHLAPYIKEEDLDVLYEVINRDCPFEEANDFILISKMPSHNINIGAALPYVMEFLDK